MKENIFNSDLFAFLKSSPTSFHAVAHQADHLLRAGFILLDEGQAWNIEQGRSYFLIRDNGALIAFTLGSEAVLEDGFRILATHSDSPGLQIKPRAEKQAGTYLQLGVEVYGGPLFGPWFDRDLSLAGRLCGQLADGSLRTLLIDFVRPLLILPSLALHFERSANESKAINAQNHLSPLIAQSFSNQLPDFSSILKGQISRQYPEISVNEVLGFEMFCYDCQQPVFSGLNGEFISAGRLDNLLSCQAAMTAMADSDKRHNSLYYCANHEEIGSISTSGARGAFLDSVFERLFQEAQGRRIALHRSFLVSVDNAHALHPNYRDSSEQQHEIVLNRGPVIKYNANQRYATNSVSSSLFKLVAKEADIPLQEFVMRSDLACGSTIGPLSAARLGVQTVDIGAPTLAMHSIREVTGSKDPYLLYGTILQFLDTEIDFCQRG